MTATLRDVRNTRPATAQHLADWTFAYTGVRVSGAHVCRDHSPPLDWYAAMVLDRPPMALVLGARGSSKSFTSALATHVDSRSNRGLGTCILGGSKSQSAQIFEGLTTAVLDGRGPGGSDRDTLARLMRTEARYRNGSRVSMLAASATSIRGPHVASLRLDEVDEIEADTREGAMGMSMALHGVTASVTMTSTWHRVGGPMTDLVERGRAGEFPLWTTCTLDVLERCPPERSGVPVGGDSLFEHCPACPLRPWCHRERDRNGNRALAKLADGHYAISSLIQKISTVSARTFEADYLCAGPRPDGLWFKDLDVSRVVTDRAEYDPKLPVHLAVDSGVYTGAVAFQSTVTFDGKPVVHVFMDYLAEGKTARENAEALVLALAGRNGTRRRVTSDPAGGARNPVGPTVLAEYRSCGLDVQPWPGGLVADGLATVEALLSPADGSPRLLIHPRCKALAVALQNYRRAKRAGQYLDYPEDPQHPHEDLVDALRGGLRAEFPEGLVRAPVTQRRAGVKSLFY